MKFKYTPWYPGGTKPIRRGVYQRNFSLLRQKETRVFSYWNGQHWKYASKTIDGAIKTGGMSRAQCLPWRGLRK